MKVEKNADRVGKEVTVTEGMKVLYSVTASGAPLEEDLKIEYLKGESPDVVVQTTMNGGEPKNWDLAAIVNGDFISGKLNKVEFKSYAEEVVGGTKDQVIILRRIIRDNSDNIIQPDRSTPPEQVVHSQVRELGS